MSQGKRDKVKHKTMCRVKETECGELKIKKCFQNQDIARIVSHNGARF